MEKDETKQTAIVSGMSFNGSPCLLLDAVVMSYGSFENVPEVLMNLFADQCNREAQIIIKSEYLGLGVP
jgi:hypothetical protein